jgi:hypothetical protein
VRTTRAFAVVSQSVNWALKSAGDSKCRPGMNEVSKNPLRRSTTPLDSGSFGGSSTILVASVPANTAAGSVNLRRPIPDSLSQINRRGTRPSWVSSSQHPSSRSWVLRVGIIRPSMNRECAAVMTSTGSNVRDPSSSRTLRGGNHRSHCATSPGAQDNRSAGSIER